MKKNILKRVLTLALAALLALSLFACGKKNNDSSTSTSGANSYKVGICNYVDDASLNQIVDNIKTQLAAIGQGDCAVDIGGVAHCSGHEFLAGDCSHGIENPRFIDAAGAKLAVDHGAAGSGVGAGAALLCGRHHSKNPSCPLRGKLRAWSVRRAF